MPSSIMTGKCTIKWANSGHDKKTINKCILLYADDQFHVEWLETNAKLVSHSPDPLPISIFIIMMSCGRKNGGYKLVWVMQDQFQILCCPI